MILIPQKCIPGPLESASTSRSRSELGSKFVCGFSYPCALAVETVQRHRAHINRRRRRERRALAVQKDRTAGNWSAEHMGEEEEAEHVKEGEEDTLADRTAGDYFQTH